MGASLAAEAGHIETVAAHEQQLALEPDEAQVTAQAGVETAREAVEAAEQVVAHWTAARAAAIDEAALIEREAGERALQGVDSLYLMQELSQARAAVDVANSALDAAMRSREQAGIDHERAVLLLRRAELAQHVRRADEDYRLVMEALEPLRKRPGGLHCTVKVMRQQPEVMRGAELQAREATINQRQRRLDTARIGGGAK